MNKRSIAALASGAGLAAAIAAFVMPHEGLGPQQDGKAIAYADPGYGWSLPTICAGHTRGVLKGQTASQGECMVFLKDDIQQGVLPCLVATVTVPVTQEQAVVLGDFVFNVGCGAFGKSSLLRKFNAGDCHGAAMEFERWNKSNGRVLPGLVKRRAAERKVFEADCAGETR